MSQSPGAALETHHWGAVPSSLISPNQRRLEARTYLTDGYGLRQRIEALEGGWTPVSKVATVTQPSRLKGFTVSPGMGLPFLSAGQAFEARPRVRKWLAAPLVPDQAGRLVDEGMILLSCSGEVGRITAVYPEHLGVTLTHDLLRVRPIDSDDYGWLYAYMKTRVFHEIARSSQYGHMIKHLEPEHVLSMPVVMPVPEKRDAIGELIVEALETRRSARRLQDQAYERYADAVNPSGHSLADDDWGFVPVREVAAGRRRLEGQFARSKVRALEALVEQSATRGVESVGEVTASVRLGSRFKRYFGKEGTPYRSASELFDVNAPVTKRIYAGLLGDPTPYLLEPGELIMACSGQTYGLLGRTLILDEAHAGVFGSHDLIRITPNEEVMRTGYLHTALSHEEYGRPRVVRHASGTSIPHLDPIDVRQVILPRFDVAVEDRIADLSEDSARLSRRADDLESEAIARATVLIDEAVGVGVDSVT